MDGGVCWVGLCCQHSPSRTWMSGSFESVRWNACVHRLDLSLYSHRKEFWGNSQNPCVFHSKKNIPSTGKKILLRGGLIPHHCIKQCSKPNTLPTSYFGPLTLIPSIQCWVCYTKTVSFHSFTFLSISSRSHIQFFSSVKNSVLCCLHPVLPWTTSSIFKIWCSSLHLRKRMELSRTNFTKPLPFSVSVSTASKYSQTHWVLLSFGW